MSLQRLTYKKLNKLKYVIQGITNRAGSNVWNKKKMLISLKYIVYLSVKSAKETCTGNNRQKREKQVLWRYYMSKTVAINDVLYIPR